MLTAFVLAAVPVAASAQDTTPDLEMWRLDCGTLAMGDLADFSDAHLYDGQSRDLVVSCYLIRHGSNYLLWDTGLATALIGNPMKVGVNTGTLERSIVDQLGDLGLTAASVTHVAVSHYHFDHTSQLPDFANAMLLVGAKDWEAVKATPEPGPLLDPRPFAPWTRRNDAEVVAIAKDHDVFGDGSVLIKAMPGHTPGHASLLVRLPEKGDVLLTGDLYHFEEQVTNRGVPEFNVDRADTLASMARFDATAKALDATVIIQHDSRHVDRLPAFPKGAR